MKEIREKPGVPAGDDVETLDIAWHDAVSATLAEWDSAYDHENFDDL